MWLWDELDEELIQPKMVSVLFMQSFFSVLAALLIC